MGRKSVREERRADLVAAYARVLSEHGQTGATIAAIAAEAGVATGLVHHHFAGKHDLQSALLDALAGKFRAQMALDSGTVAANDAETATLAAYTEATLGLGPKSDLVAARAWVALFAEAQSDAILFQKVRRLLDVEVDTIVRRSRGALETADACAVLSFVMGALVFGAFAPKKSAGFAAPRLQVLVGALTKSNGKKST